MNWEETLYNENEKPLDRLVDGYSHTSIFRTMAFIGDSLSSGEFETRDEDGNKGYHDFFEYSWGQYIARKNGIFASSLSRGGMTAEEYIESYAENNGYWSEDYAAQAYVIALGVNDVYNRDMPVGNISDINEDYKKNAKTFVGYYAAIVARYKQISPDAKFFFVTFPNEPDRRDGEKTRSVIEQLYNLAGYFENAYVIDLYKYGPVYDERFREKFFMYGHMNPSGYILTAQIIDSYIDYIVRYNPKDFENVAFINSRQTDWKLVNGVSIPPEWYWTKSIHDAEIKDVFVNEAPESEEYENCLVFRLDCSDAMYERDISEIRFYNYELVSEEFSPEKFENGQWMGDVISFVDGRYRLDVELYDEDQSDYINFVVLFENAEVIK